jgi:ribosomal protein L33
MLVRLVSAAGTGYFYTMRRNRARPEKLVLMKHDPIGEINDTL